VNSSTTNTVNIQLQHPTQFVASPPPYSQIATTYQYTPGYISTSSRQSSFSDKVFIKKKLSDAYLLWCSPLGLLGAHHFYLNRPIWGFLHMFTLGHLLFGYFYDLVRIPDLVNDVNNAMTSKDKRRVIDEKAKLSDAYLLWLPPLGLFGFHHFYLDRPSWGALCMFTFSFFGIGWLADLIRIPELVRDFNDGNKFQASVLKKTFDAYLLWLPPFGLLGAHQFHLNRVAFGWLYFCTLGMFGIGWLSDFIRMINLVQTANNPEMQTKIKTFDAYLLWIPPFGILGFHHFFLGDYNRGLLYLCSFGILGMGWLYDLFKLRHYVKLQNEKIHPNYINNNVYEIYYPVMDLV